MNNTLTRPEKRLLRLEKKRRGAERRADRLQHELLELKDKYGKALNKIIDLETQVYNLEFPPEPERW
jgi:predicted  nucleic acid-binding Zn-ribbon protein